METPPKRKPGRPCKPGGPDQQFSIRMPEHERLKLLCASKATGKSKSQLIARCVNLSLNQVCIEVLDEQARRLRELINPTPLPDEAMAGEQEID